MLIAYTASNTHNKSIGLSFLVSSLAGRSRSVSMATAYIMHKEGISLNSVLTRIRETRSQADPNPSFMRQLKELESELKIKQ